MFTDTNDSGGIAWLLTNQRGNEAYAYSITRVQQASWTNTLAHEIGHNKKKHTVFLLLLNLLLMGLGLWLMSLLLTWEPLFEAFGMQPSAHGALFLVTTLSAMVGFVLSPLPHILSRTFEYQADAYAATHTGTKDLSTALISLTRENLSNLFPHPIYSFFYYSHPTVPERIRAMEKANKSG